MATKNKVIATVLLSVLSYNAFAQPVNNEPRMGLKIEGDREVFEIAQKQKYLKGIVTQIGESSDKGEKLDGFASNLQLIEVLRQIIPMGWKATASKSVNINKLVSWQGGKNWVDTLKDVAENNTLNILIDWNSKTVRLLSEDNLIALNKSREKISEIYFDMPQRVGKSVYESNSGNNSDMNRNNKNEVASSSLPKVGVSGTWYVKEGTLKDNLEQLLESNKIKLVYPDTVANYSIDDSFVLEGTLDGEDGVLAQIANLYTAQRVKQALEFELKTGSTNKVLVISNKTYQQRFFEENN